MLHPRKAAVKFITAVTHRGFGVNIKAPRQIDQCLKHIAEFFLHHFIARYDQWAEKGFKSIEKDWRSRAYHIGKPIEVIVGETQHAGTYMGIDSGGNLLLKDAKGKISCISAGDVFFKEMA